MKNLSNDNVEKWNRILNTASLELLQVTIEHSEVILTSLLGEERRVRESALLSAPELEELNSFEAKKNLEVSKTKFKKLERDNVPGHGGSYARGVRQQPCLPLVDAVDREEGVDSMPGEPPLGVECSDGGGQIVNLAKIKLSATEISVLSRGLTFCPSNGKYSELTLLKHLDNFARTLRLREYFFDRSDGENAKSSFVAKHHWTPSAQREENLDLYIRAVQREVFQAYQSHRTRYHNITKNEQDALNALSNRQDIVIKPADKGGGIVILDRNDYVKVGDRQLGDRKFYKPLLSDPTKEHQTIVNNVLDQLVGAREIDRKLARALTSAHPVVGRFYMLPKLHKIGNLGRPIISGIGTITEPISG